MNVAELGEIYTAILNEVLVDRPSYAMPESSLKGLSTNLNEWDDTLARNVFNDLSKTLRGLVEDLGYDPDMLPQPPAALRSMDLDDEGKIVLTLPDPDEETIEHIKQIPSVSWDAQNRVYYVQAAEPAIEGLRNLVRVDRFKVSETATEVLKKLALRLQSNPNLGNVAMISVENKKVVIRFNLASPSIADALKRVPSCRWDGEISAFTAPLTRLREILLIAKKYPIAVHQSAQTVAEENESPLVFDGTLDGLTGVPIHDLNSVKGKKAENFAEFGISTVFDLLMLTPRRYLDRSNLTTIRSLQEGQEVGLLATVSNIQTDPRKRMVRITLTDSTGKINATYFNAIWQAKRFRVGDQVSVYGKVDSWQGSGRPVLSLSNPVMDPVGDETLPIIPIYPQSAKSRITTWEIQSAILEAFRRIPNIVDPMPESIVEKHELVSRLEALKHIHTPNKISEAEKARERLAFDELFRMQTALLLLKNSEETEVGVTHEPTGKLTGILLDSLPFGLTNAQKRAIDEIVNNLKQAHPMHRLLQGDVGAGKAQPLSSKVLTPSGYIKMGDIKVGDKVVNPTGYISEVLGVFPQGEREIYKIHFSDGTSVRADGEHLWSVRTSVMRHKNREPKTMTTLEIMEDLTENNGSSKWHIELISPADLESGEDRPLDPYLLGMLLGDGSFRNQAVGFTTIDVELLDSLKELIPESCGLNISRDTRNNEIFKCVVNNKKLPEITEGLSVKDVKKILSLYEMGYSTVKIAEAAGVSRTPIQDIIKQNGLKSDNRSRKNAVVKAIESLGLLNHDSYGKFIPKSYLNAPVEVRHSILQGLLDTDGTLDYRTGYNVSYSTVSDQLAEDVAWLVRSLGGRAQVVRRTRKSGLSWHISLSLPECFPPFRLERKSMYLSTRVKYAYPARAIIKIEKDGTEEAQCILVSHPNHLYITDNFTITHNTMVATTALLTALESGFQGAMMAPTEILATQLYNELVERTDGLTDVDGMPLRIEFFSNKLRGKKREEALNALASGEIHIAVGTHALLVDDVLFKNLGLAVIDEQHRFGVEQRAKLRSKGPVVVSEDGSSVHIRPDMLVMTATPIPRTAAMTVFGDLDVSILDELPPGRTPIETSWIDASPDLEDSGSSPWDIVREEVAAGRQAYVVCPLVEESEKLQVASAVETFESLAFGALKGLSVGLVHGKMNSDERKETMEKFRNNELNVLVATTVIEVGVNVPNATVMVILDSGRFGIAQLHQLRGRVGRGVFASKCVLVGRCVSSDSRARMEALVESTDGFWLSEVDLNLRGHGQVFGSVQSGQSDLRVADLDKDKDLLVLARKEALILLDEDPLLNRRPQLRSEIATVLGVEAQEWLVKS